MKNILPKRPSIELTQEGLKKIQQEFDDYTNKRPQAVINLRTAREMGDLSENAAYHAARFELTTIDRNIRRLGYILKFAKVVERTHTGLIQFGSKVKLATEEGKKLEFMLVSGYEADPLQHQLSVYSPIGKAILNKKAGDTVTVTTPVGLKKYTIESVD